MGSGHWPHIAFFLVTADFQTCCVLSRNSHISHEWVWMYSGGHAAADSGLPGPGRTRAPCTGPCTVGVLHMTWKVTVDTCEVCAETGEGHTELMLFLFPPDVEDQTCQRQTYYHTVAVC